MEWLSGTSNRGKFTDIADAQQWERADRNPDTPLKIGRRRTVGREQDCRVIAEPQVRYLGQVDEYGRLLAANRTVGKGNITEPINSPRSLVLWKDSNPW